MKFAYSVRLMLPSLLLMSFTAAGAAETANIQLAQAPQQAPAQPPPTPQQRVAMLKQWMQASQMQLRAYEWIETTVIAKGGEEKSRKQNTCYYGADGKVQKVPVAAPEADSGGGRLGKRIKANKKEEIADYMQSAAALVHSYIPPDSSRIQQSVDAGKMSMNVTQPGRSVRLDFKDYLKPGDVLSVDIETPTNRLLGMHVSSYLDDTKDAIQMDIAMGVFPDGTIYTAKSTLAAPAKDMTVTIENTGYRHASH
jgi:hypothetical protein